MGDADARGHQHVVVLVDREERGLADADAGEINQPGRLHLDVGDLGVGDEEAGEFLVDPDQLTGPDHHLDRFLGGRHHFEGADRARRGGRQRGEGRGEGNGEGMLFHCSHVPCVGGYSVVAGPGAGAGASVAWIATPRTTCTLVVEVTSDSSVWRRAEPRRSRVADQGLERPRTGVDELAAGVVFVFAAVADRVQHQRERAEGLGEGDHLGLLGGDLEGRGLGDGSGFRLAVLRRPAWRLRGAGRRRGRGGCA